MAGNWNPNMPSATTSGSRTIAQLLDNDIYLNDKQVSDKHSLDLSIKAIQETITDMKANMNMSGWQLFTSSGVFKVPNSVSKLYISGCGGGGAGGSCYFPYWDPNGVRGGSIAGCGGYAECKLLQYVGVQPGASYQVTVGGGGVAVIPTYQWKDSNYAASGGTSSFSNLISMRGGTGGENTCHVYGSGIPGAYAGYKNYGADGSVPGGSIFAGVWGVTGTKYTRDEVPDNRNEPFFVYGGRSGTGNGAGGGGAATHFKLDEGSFNGKGANGTNGFILVAW